MKKFKFVSEETKKTYLKDIIAYFQDERNEEIGVIAAEDILDFFLEKIGNDIYKIAVQDIKKLLEEKFEDVNIDLDLLTEKDEH